MADVFSYENNVKPVGQIASSDFARVAVSEGDQRNALVQNLDVSYQQQIEEVLQVGDTQVYWLPGRPQGRIGIQSLVGADGFFQGWKAPCGLINTASVKLGANGDTANQCQFKGTGTLSFQGAVVESLNLQMNTGRQTIAQGADVRVASMSATGGGGGGGGDTNATLGTPAGSVLS